MKQAILVTIAIILGFFSQAQNGTTSQSFNHDNHQFFQEVLQLTAAFVSDPEQHVLFAEFNKNKNDLPHGYLNVQEEGFVQPLYSANWNIDISLFRKALLSWSIDQPDSFLKALSLKGIGNLSYNN